MRPVCTYTDFFVVCTGQNPRQTKAIYDEVHSAHEAGLAPAPALGRRRARGDVDPRGLPRRRAARLHARGAGLLPRSRSCGATCPRSRSKPPPRSPAGNSTVRAPRLPSGHALDESEGRDRRERVATEATKLGIPVLRPNVDVRYDIVLDLGSRFLRVQCKWAVLRGDVICVRCYSSRRTADGLRRLSYSVEEVDALAAYCATIDRCYLIPAARIAERSEFQLRLAPSRNNQRAGVNWAREYEFAATLSAEYGAIAQLGERVAGSHEVAGSSPAGSISP